MQAPNPVTSIAVPTSGTFNTLVVKVLLDIIYTLEPTGCQDIELAYKVITLAEEWQCETVPKILKKDLAIQALVNSTDGPSNDHLRLAMKLGDHHLMALIAQRDRNPGLKSRIPDSAEADLTGVRKTYDQVATGLLEYAGLESPGFELGGLSYGEFLRMPPTVLWALARSTYLARKDPGEVDVDEMAQLFENLLKEACKSVFCGYELTTIRSGTGYTEEVQSPSGNFIFRGCPISQGSLTFPGLDSSER
jgi:hypothetical protein